MATELKLLVNDVEVDVTSAKINLRTINQGHSMFTAMVDNFSGAYNGVFNTNDSIEIRASNITLFKGTIDSVKHVKEQDAKWDLMDYIRIAGRDLSYDLSNKKYTRTFPTVFQIDNMISEALSNTGCSVSITGSASPTIDGHTAIDQPLLDLVTEILERAQYEGYVDTNSELKYFPIGTYTAAGILIDKTNCLSAQEIEVQGEDIKNSVEVFGALNLQEPSWLDDVGAINDLWTEDTTSGWTLLHGASLEIDGSSHVGDNSIQVFIADDEADFKFTMDAPIRVGQYGQFDKLSFYNQFDFGFSMLYLYALELHTDDSNYFTTYVPVDWFGTLIWKHEEFPLGVEQVISDENPEGLWTQVGFPDWLNINYVRFHLWWLWGGEQWVKVDGLKFEKKRTHGFAEDATSIASYEKRQLVKVGDAQTNDECQDIADDLVERLANPTSVLQVQVPLSALIDEGVWKGIPGYKVLVEEIV